MQVLHFCKNVLNHITAITVCAIYIPLDHLILNLMDILRVRNFQFLLSKPHYLGTLLRQFVYLPEIQWYHFVTQELKLIFIYLELC